MRAIDCPCGHRLEGADDAELFRLACVCLASEALAWWERRTTRKEMIAA